MSHIRVLIAKPGLDGHDRGALMIAQVLRDEGMEVIYTGLRQTPEQIAKAAVHEDVDVIGLSSLSGAHKTLFPKVIEQLRQLSAEDIPVIGGGIIPSQDMAVLYEQGIKKIFTSGTPPKEIANYIKQLIQQDDPQTAAPKKIAHIGIAVKQLADVLPFYEDQLGLTCEAIEEVTSDAVKIAFLKVGDIRIELLEPLNDKSPIYKFIERKGEGIHHIALEVDDLRARLTKLKEQQIRLVDDVPRLGANDSQIAFIHPQAAHGVLFELCQYDDVKKDL